MSKKKGRPLNGILLLDKPYGMSSNQALQRVKYLFEAKKAGHTGSLDPLATGMLPLCFGRATKFAAYLLDSDKCYRTIAKLGVTTTTADTEGDILETADVPVLTPEMVEAVVAPFRGVISQIPPMYSALKHQGRPLYELARKGMTVEREPRQVTIHSLEANIVADDEIELIIRCTKGTYVRTLVEDIGAALGCGAHVSALRRDFVSPYQDGKMHSLEALVALKGDKPSHVLDSLLLPIESALGHFPVLEVASADCFYLKLGNEITLGDASTPGFVRLYSGAGFIGLGEVKEGQLVPRKMVE